MLNLRADYTLGSHALTRDDYRHSGAGAEAWHAAVVSADDAALDLVGSSTYPYGSDPDDRFIETVRWVNQELLHRRAEFALLRDLDCARRD